MSKPAHAEAAVDQHGRRQAAQSGWVREMSSRVGATISPSMRRDEQGAQPRAARAPVLLVAVHQQDS